MASNGSNGAVAAAPAEPEVPTLDDNIADVYEAVDNYTFGINDIPPAPGSPEAREEGEEEEDEEENGQGHEEDEEEDEEDEECTNGEAEEGADSAAETESTCSMEECVARIESTLRRNFKKLQVKNNSVNGRRNKKDITKLPGYQPVPENCPKWKKAMIEKKNSQLLDDVKRDLEAKKAEEDKWRDVPAWKKNLILEKEKKKTDTEAPTEAERQRMQEENKRLESMPDWKRKLILQKRGDN